MPRDSVCPSFLTQCIASDARNLGTLNKGVHVFLSLVIVVKIGIVRNHDPSCFTFLVVQCMHLVTERALFFWTKRQLKNLGGKVGLSVLNARKKLKSKPETRNQSYDSVCCLWGVKLSWFAVYHFDYLDGGRASGGMVSCKDCFLCHS